jgi:predicted SnoaL-like aldol condensation-catalyzing enzyme
MGALAGVPPRRSRGFGVGRDHSQVAAGVGATDAAIQTSASHIFRVREDRLVENWQVVDTYRILVAIGAIPGVASCFQQLLGVPESPNGLVQERLGTDFGRRGRPITREESRAVTRRLFDGAIDTGRAEDVDALSETYMQNTGWTPDGRSVFGNAWRSAAARCPTALLSRPTPSPKVTAARRSVDYVRLYQSFGLLPGDVEDA